MRKAEATVAALLLLLPGSAAAPSWEVVGPGVTIVLPRDDGAHLQHRTEWWYLTGVARAADGGEVGWQLPVARWRREIASKFNALAWRGYGGRRRTANPRMPLNSLSPCYGRGIL